MSAVMAKAHKAAHKIKWRCFETREQMVDELAEACCEALMRGIRKRGTASWAVSGGSTPKPLFDAMSQAEIDWENIQVALVDERWVDLGHPRSNEAFMRAALQKGHAAEAMYIGMKTPHATPFEAVEAVNARYAQVKQPFDSVLLGLGSDGHTASFFPDAEGLDAALDINGDKTCVALRAKRSDVTGDEVDRMSISASAIAKAPHVVLMITGDEKKAVLERALAVDTHLPIAKLAEHVTITVYWAP
ncbi:6-phosphogluconolactonase [Kordiimonas lipolytica]|uniref:6-phosphogluconolactonase n=1 Tax=Kordiimonas lipolytica TaxID=1662421 RepID=A0ABV8UFN8_9PROT|nr:6-phosphogluconolactonase [Kordiimonas lipolytica]